MAESEANRWLNVVKEAAVEAVEATNPVEVCIGTVKMKKPLIIDVGDNLLLEKWHLVLTRNVTDHWITMKVNHETEEETCCEKHVHKYKGDKTYLVLNGLNKDEKVLLLRQQGGQKYIVIDRVVSE